MKMEEYFDTLFYFSREASAQNWVNTRAVKMFLQLLKTYNLHFKKTYKILSAKDSLDGAKGAAKV